MTVSLSYPSPGTKWLQVKSRAKLAKSMAGRVKWARASFWGPVRMDKLPPVPTKTEQKGAMKAAHNVWLRERPTATEWEQVAVLNVNRVLAAELGVWPRALGSRGGREQARILEMLVAAPLTPQTNDLTSEPAYVKMRTRRPLLSYWHSGGADKIAELQGLIRGAGFGRQTAEKIIRTISMCAVTETGDLKFPVTNTANVAETREELMRAPGIGECLANKVLLYALGVDTFVVDINVLHVLVDLNLAPEPASWPNSSNDQRNAATTFNALLKPGSKAPFHFFLNMLGKMRSKKKDKYEELLIKLKKEVRETKRSFFVW